MSKITIYQYKALRHTKPCVNLLPNARDDIM